MTERQSYLKTCGLIVFFGGFLFLLFVGVPLACIAYRPRVLPAIEHRLEKRIDQAAEKILPGVDHQKHPIRDRLKRDSDHIHTESMRQLGFPGQ